MKNPNMPKLDLIKKKPNMPKLDPKDVARAKAKKISAQESVVDGVRDKRIRKSNPKSDAAHKAIREREGIEKQGPKGKQQQTDVGAERAAGRAVQKKKMRAAGKVAEALIKQGGKKKPASRYPENPHNRINFR